MKQGQGRGRGEATKIRIHQLLRLFNRVLTMNFIRSSWILSGEQRWGRLAHGDPRLRGGGYGVAGGGRLHDCASRRRTATNTQERRGTTKTDRHLRRN